MKKVTIAVLCLSVLLLGVVFFNNTLKDYRKMSEHEHAQETLTVYSFQKAMESWNFKTYSRDEKLCTLETYAFGGDFEPVEFVEKVLDGYDVHQNHLVVVVYDQERDYDKLKSYCRLVGSVQVFQGEQLLGTTTQGDFFVSTFDPDGPEIQVRLDTEENFIYSCREQRGFKDLYKVLYCSVGDK